MTTSPDRNLKEEIFQALKKENYELTCEVMANSTALAVKNGQVQKLNGQVKELNEMVVRLNEREAKTQKLLHQFEKSEMGLQLEMINMRKEMEGKESNLMELTKQIEELNKEKKELQRAMLDSVAEMNNELAQQVEEDEKLFKWYVTKYKHQKVPAEYKIKSPLNDLGLHDSIMERMEVYKQNPADALKLMREERDELDRLAKIGEEVKNLEANKKRIVEKELADARMEIISLRKEMDEAKTQKGYVTDMTLDDVIRVMQRTSIGEHDGKKKQLKTEKKEQLIDLLQMRGEEKNSKDRVEADEENAKMGESENTNLADTISIKDSKITELTTQLENVTSTNERRMNQLFHEVQRREEKIQDLLHELQETKAVLKDLKAQAPQSEGFQKVEKLKNQLQMARDEMKKMKMKYEERLKSGDETNAHHAEMISIKDNKIAELQAKMKNTVITNQCRMNELFAEIKDREGKIQNLQYKLQNAVIRNFKSKKIAAPEAPQPEADSDGEKEEIEGILEEEELKNQLQMVRDEMKMMKMNYEKRLKSGDETNTQLIDIIKEQRTKLGAPEAPQSDSEQLKNQLQMVRDEMKKMKMEYEERLKSGDETNSQLIDTIKEQRTKLAELEAKLVVSETAPEARQPEDSDAEEWEHVEESDTK